MNRKSVFFLWCGILGAYFPKTELVKFSKGWENTFCAYYQDFVIWNAASLLPLLKQCFQCSMNKHLWVFSSFSPVVTILTIRFTSGIEYSWNMQWQSWENPVCPLYARTCDNTKWKAACCLWTLLTAAEKNKQPSSFFFFFYSYVFRIQRHHGWPCQHFALWCCWQERSVPICFSSNHTLHLNSTGTLYRLQVRWDNLRWRLVWETTFSPGTAPLDCHSPSCLMAKSQVSSPQW